MVFQFPSFTFTCTIFVLLSIIVAKTIPLIQKAKEYSSTNWPPGPWRIPLIGNLHQLVGFVLPHHRLRDLAKIYGPLMHLQFGEVSTIIVSSPEIAEEVLKTNDIIFAQRPSFFSFTVLSYNNEDIIFSPHGTYWRHLRKICNEELLSTHRVVSFRSIREDEVSKLIKSIRARANEGSLVNLSEEIFALTYGITSRIAFGNKCKDQEAFISSIKKVVHLASGFSVVDFFPSRERFKVISGMRSKIEKLHRENDRILEDILNDHKKKIITTKNGIDQEDLVDVFLKLQHNGVHDFSITDNNIKSVLWDIFVAGSETSSTTIEWAMAEMLKNPRVMKKAQDEVRRVFDGKMNVDENGIQELKYLTSIVKETLRLHPPGAFLPRENKEGIKINGYEIPIKTRVVVNLWAIGRDPNYWNEAETFYPERFLDSSIDYKGNNFQYLPFGSGRRRCPGTSFALPTIELQLAQLLFHFDWKLPNGIKREDLDMTEAYGVSVRRKNNLLLVPIPYHSFSSM